MTQAEQQALIRQMEQTLASIQRDLGRLEGRGHAVHRAQIQKGVIHPSSPAIPPETEREERVGGIQFATLLQPFRN